MSMPSSEIPYGTYEVEIGESFASIQSNQSMSPKNSAGGNFYTLKCLF